MRRWLLAAVAIVLANSLTPTANAAGQDYDIANGHFFTQTAGDLPGGFSVTNDDGAPFWSTFKSYGGVYAVGYPISRRFIWEGQPAQAFQKAVFHWRPDLKRVVFVNVFDELSKGGKDIWLKDVRLVPKPAPIPDEDKLDFPTIVARRQALLNQVPAIRDLYDTAEDPLTLYGLPTSPIEDYGSVLVVRLQRATFQQWKTARPWAKPGEVVVANGGDVAKEAGLFPAAAIVVEPPGGVPAGSAVAAPVAQPLSASADPSVTPFAGPTAAPAITTTATITNTTATPKPAATATPKPAATVAASPTIAPPAPQNSGPTGITIPTIPTATNGAIVIAIDPGHGGTDSGAVAKFQDGFILREKDINLTVATKVVAGLRAAGFWVVMTRDSDTVVNRERKDLTGDGQIDMADELQARIDISNAAKANLFLSIHHNGHENPDLNGIEVYSCRDRPFTDLNRRLGLLVEQNILSQVRASGYDLSTRGQKDCFDASQQKYYYVIGPIAENRPRATNQPGIIGEAMFVSNPFEAAKLRDDKVLSAEARGYVDAVKKFFGK